jgi:hypothetical protein
MGSFSSLSIFMAATAVGTTTLATNETQELKV